MAAQVAAEEKAGDEEARGKVAEEEPAGWFDRAVKFATCNASRGTRLLLVAAVSVVLYYADFGSDVALTVELDKAGEPALRNVMILLLVLNPVVLMGVGVWNFQYRDPTDHGWGFKYWQSKGGFGPLGLLLGLTNTRMLSMLFGPYMKCSRTLVGASASASAQAVSDCKLFEAALEAMPQPHLQMAILLLGVLTDTDPALVYFSLVMSVLTLSHVFTEKYAAMLDIHDNLGVSAAAALYFAADALPRSLAAAVLAVVFGYSAVGYCAAGMFVLDLAVQTGQHLFKRPTAKGNYRENHAGSNDELKAGPGSDDADEGGMSALRQFGSAISVPSAALAVLTSLPLSTRKHDQLRMFLPPVAWSAAMVAASLAREPGSTPGSGPGSGPSDPNPAATLERTAPAAAAYVCIGAITLKVLLISTVLFWSKAGELKLRASTGLAVFAFGASEQGLTADEANRYTEKGRSGCGRGRGRRRGRGRGRGRGRTVRACGAVCAWHNLPRGRGYVPLARLTTEYYHC